jgi:hypothetical protein
MPCAGRIFASASRMHFLIDDKGEYLRADLLSRETVAETEDFLNAVREAALRHPGNRTLIVVHSPRAFFRVERFHATAFLEELAAHPQHKVALVAQHLEVRLVHQYVEVLARLKRANLRAFAHEPGAIRWLTQPDSPERETIAETPR